mmetsp:Transcript_14897/g.18704  ORF Transcript_14897/g.18704 Transcript_14897/m.18704 type:complete len:93 (+) Transcript_14897:719-997(+)
MATATKVIVDSDSKQDKGDFSVLYTAMNTGDFTKIEDSDSTGPFVAVVFEIILMCSTMILQAGVEPREDIIEVIMKRLGVQKSILVIRDFIF